MKYQNVIYRLAGFLFSGVCLSLATGCTDEQAIEGPESDAMSEIHFHTSAFTRAEETNLESGAKVHVYPYHQKTGVTAPIITGGKAYTVSGADLAPEGTDATAMLLPSGTFGFYAVSTNSASKTVPTFDTTAENGIPFKNENNSGGDKRQRCRNRPGKRSGLPVCLHFTDNSVWRQSEHFPAIQARHDTSPADNRILRNCMCGICRCCDKL